jgi:hypothetical protein
MLIETGVTIEKVHIRKKEETKENLNWKESATRNEDSLEGESK